MARAFCYGIIQAGHLMMEIGEDLRVPCIGRTGDVSSLIFGRLSSSPCALLSSEAFLVRFPLMFSQLLRKDLHA